MATTPKAIESSKATESGKKRLRSPAYPYLNLETAIKRAKTFYDREGRNLAHLNVAAGHWGYEPKSSGAWQTAAALMSFGLMQDEGTGDKRKLKLTQNALKILLDTRTDSSERETLIKQAAVAPRIHQQIWAKWGVGISDENLRHALVFEWEPPFNENSVDGFIREYRDTIAFAKLIESDKVNAEEGDNEPSSGPLYVPKVGDYVQWESQGIMQMREPQKVRAISTDGTHAFVDGSSTGLPINQLSRAKAPMGMTPQIAESRIPLPPNKSMQEDVFSLSEGRVVIQWPAPLSAESIQDLKDWLKIVERKITRSAVQSTEEKQTT